MDMKHDGPTEMVDTELAKLSVAFSLCTCGYVCYGCAICNHRLWRDQACVRQIYWDAREVAAIPPKMNVDDVRFGTRSGPTGARTLGEILKTNMVTAWVAEPPPDPCESPSYADQIEALIDLIEERVFILEPWRANAFRAIMGVPTR